MILPFGIISFSFDEEGALSSKSGMVYSIKNSLFAEVLRSDVEKLGITSYVSEEFWIVWILHEGVILERVEVWLMCRMVEKCSSGSRALPR